MTKDSKRRPIGQYMCTRLKRARLRLGGWVPLARMIPAARKNSKQGHAHPNWLGQVANNPKATINATTRRRLKAVLRQVLKDEPKPKPSPTQEFLRQQAGRKVRRTSTVAANPRQLSMFTHDGSEVRGSVDDMVELIGRLTDRNRS